MKGKILLATMLLVFVLAVTVSHAQPPSNFKYTVYTPDGLKPGAKIAINVELDTKKSDAVFVFVKIFAFPVYADSGEDFEYLGLALGEQYVDAYQTGANALKQYAYQGVLTQSTTYGFAILPKLRLPGKYTGNITLTVPGDATCGETLFVFFLVSADDNVTKFIIPVGLVCEEEFRQSIYYESSVSSLNDKIQSLTDTVGSLRARLGVSGGFGISIGLVWGMSIAEGNLSRIVPVFIGGSVTISLFGGVTFSGRGSFLVSKTLHSTYFSSRTVCHWLRGYGLETSSYTEYWSSVIAVYHS